MCAQSPRLMGEIHEVRLSFVPRCHDIASYAKCLKNWFSRSTGSRVYPQIAETAIIIIIIIIIISYLFRSTNGF
jgi:hypothetical protein